MLAPDTAIQLQHFSPFCRSLFRYSALVIALKQHYRVLIARVQALDRPRRLEPPSRLPLLPCALLSLPFPSRGQFRQVRELGGGFAVRGGSPTQQSGEGAYLPAFPRPKYQQPPPANQALLAGQGGGRRSVHALLTCPPRPSMRSAPRSLIDPRPDHAAEPSPTMSRRPASPPVEPPSGGPP